MHFSIAAFVLSMEATVVVADLHTKAICIDSKGGAEVYNAEATKIACGYYFMRNKGDDWWNTCPDCTLQTDEGVYPYCSSPASHIGGDEASFHLSNYLPITKLTVSQITYYCKLAGAWSATSN
ncbi:hypothetical protein BJ875DRAFT_489601 [Amylocarpus encephaloides]|uniref:Secreted protein n=1 Tax=Amylocarpus encephaloides TaxID=45428 RepID=A0A9P8C120_9HELO|nr:hypothetical protein BJ875DRAFT_489601 [Amylocarpus encephaloides]